MDRKDLLAYKRDLVGVRTESVYMRTRKNQSLEDLPDDKLRRGMCPRSCGRLDVCHGCGAPCTVGRILMGREARG